MRSSTYLFSTVLLSVVSVINGVIYPTSPLSDTVWKVGSSVEITWENRGEPNYKDMEPFTVDLYTGMNDSQRKLANIGTNVSTNTTSIKYTVPDVKPYGKIYFLRFTFPNPKDHLKPFLYWSTRFTITNTDNTTPSASTMAFGALVSPSDVSSSDRTHSATSVTSHLSSTASHHEASSTTEASPTLSSTSKTEERSEPHSTVESSSHAESSTKTSHVVLTSHESSSKSSISPSPSEPSSSHASSKSSASLLTSTSSSEPSVSLLASTSSSTSSTVPKPSADAEHDDKKNSAGSLAPAWVFALGGISIFFM